MMEMNSLTTAHGHWSDQAMAEFMKCLLLISIILGFLMFLCPLTAALIRYIVNLLMSQLENELVCKPSIQIQIQPPIPPATTLPPEEVASVSMSTPISNDSLSPSPSEIPQYQNAVAVAVNVPRNRQRTKWITKLPTIPILPDLPQKSSKVFRAVIPVIDLTTTPPPKNRATATEVVDLVTPPPKSRTPEVVDLFTPPPPPAPNNNKRVKFNDKVGILTITPRERRPPYELRRRNNFLQFFS